MYEKQKVIKLQFDTLSFLQSPEPGSTHRLFLSNIAIKIVLNSI